VDLRIDQLGLKSVASRSKPPEMRRPVFCIAQQTLIGDTSSMKKLAALLCLVAAPAMAAENFAECIIDRVPKAQNDIAANAVFQVCQSKNPTGFVSVQQGSGRGWFSPSAAECIEKHASQTTSFRAAQLVGIACRKLYDQPAVDWERGEITQLKN